jgi:hypothetical protein
MKWKAVSTAMLFLVLAAAPVLGLQMAHAIKEDQTLTVGSWWTYKGTTRNQATGAGSWAGTLTETEDYTDKFTVTDKNSDTISLSRLEDLKWSCTATGTWLCNTDTHAQTDSGSSSKTYKYTVSLNSFTVTGVSAQTSNVYVGHPAYFMVNIGQLVEGGKAARYWWVPDNDGKGDHIADVDFSVDAQTATVKGVELKAWRLSYTGDNLGWFPNNVGVYSKGPATENDLFDPVYGILVGSSYKANTSGVPTGGAGSWTEEITDDYQLDDTNLDFSTATPPEPQTVQMTLGAEPKTDVAVTVDGVRYGSDQLPMVFDWATGSTHTLEVSPTIEGAIGVRYVFVQWSDDSKDATRTLTATEAASLTATFKTQYELTVTSDYGNPEGSGWYDANTKATFSVTTPVTDESGKRVFAHWSGDSSADTSSASVTMDGPKTVTAEWRTETTMPYTTIGIVAVIAVVVVALLLVMRRRGARRSAAAVKPPVQAAPPVSAPPARPTTPIPTQVSRAPPGAEVKYCVHCGAAIPSVVLFCTKCGKKQE